MDGSVGKIPCCTRMRTWVGSPNSHVKLQRSPWLHMAAALCWADAGSLRELSTSILWVQGGMLCSTAFFWAPLFSVSTYSTHPDVNIFIPKHWFPCLEWNFSYGFAFIFYICPTLHADVVKIILSYRHGVVWCWLFNSCVKYYIFMYVPV